MFLLFPIYVTPLAYIIFTIVCQRYKYEVIFIDTKQIRFSSSYTEKNSKTSMISFFQIEKLQEVYVMEYHELPPKKIFGITKYKNIPNYMIHFIFLGEEGYQCWGYKISIEEATRVVRRIEEFFFGTGIDLKIYGIFQKTLKEILRENCKKLDFIYAKY